jgi:hypothetical protein
MELHLDCDQITNWMLKIETLILKICREYNIKYKKLSCGVDVWSYVCMSIYFHFFTFYGVLNFTL